MLGRSASVMTHSPALRVCFARAIEPTQSFRVSAARYYYQAILVLFVICGSAEPQHDALPPDNGRPNLGATHPAAGIDDLSANAVETLRHIPGVANVQRWGLDERPTHRIVHIADLHFVEREAYAADLRSLAGEPLSEAEIDRRYSQLLDEVEFVQEQQLTVLRCLIQHHGLKRIHVEGLTRQDQAVFNAKVSALRKLSSQIAGLQKGRDELVSDNRADAETKRFIEGIKKVEAQYRRDLLQIGAAGLLLLDGEIDAVLPLEDEAAYRAADPVDSNGVVTIDAEKNEAREDGQVRLLLDSGPFALIVLGGAHDLSDNVHRLSGGQAEYIRVEVEVWKELGQEVK